MARATFDVAREEHDVTLQESEDLVKEWMDEFEVPLTNRAFRKLVQLVATGELT